MKKHWTRPLKRVAAVLLSMALVASPLADWAPASTVQADEVTITITENKGYAEGAYVEWAPVTGADGYLVYVSQDQSSWTQLDDELIRNYGTYMRADALGLTAGTWYIKIVAATFDSGKNKIADVAEVVQEVAVTAHDRSGYAWENNGTASGAYNENGSLKSNANVVYLTDANKDTVTLALSGTTYTGIQAILDAYQSSQSAPLCVRMIGNVTLPSTNGTSTNYKGDVVINKASDGLTFEGVGEDAVANGWGIRIKNASNVEVRNIGFMNCNSTEIDNVNIEKCTHIWVHNCDMFYGMAGDESDKAKGDGALDTKHSTYVTHSYNHFWDSGKCNLQGSGTSDTSNYITYHHNWYDHSDSRHPRIRVATVHVYNNYYDGNSKYGVGATTGASVYVENNYFRNCPRPMMISMQGSDTSGTLSNEDGGIIKAYNNYIEGASSYKPYSEYPTDFDCYDVTSRTATVPDSVVTVQGSNVYNNFDTAEDFYEYELTETSNVPAVVEAKAGRVNGGDFQWTFDDEEDDSSYDVNTELQAACQNYTTTLVSVGGILGYSSNVKYTITVDLADGSATTSFQVREGNEITTTELPTPTRDGYSFTGWVDENDNPIVLPYVPTANMTITATWQENASGGEELDPTALYNLELIAGNIPTGTYTSSFTKSGFTVMAGEGNESNVVVDNSSTKTINGADYTQRLKLGGIGTKDYRSIMFTAEAAATLQMGCIAATSTETYQMGVATLDSNDAFVDLTGTVTINGTATDCADGNIPVAGDSANYITMEIPEAGTYYIYGKDGGINFYFLNLVYENGVEMPTYTVTFNTMGGLSVDAQEVCQGELCIRPADPMRDGYTFEGWYADYNCSTAYDFSTPITGNITVYAKWAADESTTTSLVLDMKDIPASDYTENFSKNGFNFYATSSKNLTVSALEATVDGVAYTQCLKLNGSGTTTYRSISFTIDKEAELTVVAASGKSGTKRYLVVTDGTTTYEIANIDGAAKFTQTLTAGTWYVYSDNSGINIFYISVLGEGDDTSGGNNIGTGDGSDDITSGTEDGDDAGTTEGGDAGTTDGGDAGTTDGGDAGTTDGSDAGTNDGGDTGATDGGDKKPVNSEGLKVVLANPGEDYVYTGSAIKPAIIVTNNGEELTVGEDYTVKYSNNVKASTEKRAATITVKGKGNLTGSNSTTFKILPKNIADSDVIEGAVVVVKGSKAKPILTHNSKLLGTKDLVWEAAVKYNEDSIMPVYGKGNYTGMRIVSVKVVDKSELKKFTVTVGKEKLTYNGKEQKPTITVAEKGTGTVLTENVDYRIVYSGSRVNAGTVKFTVIGLGLYSGTVSKSYKIAPLAVKDDSIKVTGVDTDGYKFKAKGVTIGGDLTVTYKDKVLRQGKDYKISYSGNKKVGTAKYTVTFLGNYKGSTPVKGGTFKINPAPLSDDLDGLKIVAGDKVYSGKPNVYKSIPLVSVDGVLLKKSDYTVTYYKDAQMKDEITGKNKVALEDGQDSVTVYVKLVGKGNYVASNGAYATATYEVCKKPANDLSKARVTFVDASGNKLTKAEYTGNEIEPAVKVEIKNGKTWTEVPADKYEVTYFNNVNKGTASVVVTATGEDYAGSKTAKFKIVAKNLKSLSDLLKDLFGL